MAIIDFIKRAMESAGTPAGQQMVGAMQPFAEAGPWGAAGTKSGLLQPSGEIEFQPGFTVPPVAPRMMVPEAGPRGTYNPMMDPNNRGLLGMIAKLSGSPTREEAAATRGGQFSAAAWQMFQQSMQQNGGNAQQAVMEILNTPEGQEWFLNPGSDPVSELKSFMQMAQAPQKDIRTASPGDSIVVDGQVQSTIPQAPQLTTVDGNIVETVPGTGQSRVIYTAPQRPMTEAEAAAAGMSEKQYELEVRKQNFEEGKPVAPTLVPPGTAVLPQGATAPTYTNPPTLVQENEAMMQLGAMSPEQRTAFGQALAQAKLTGDMSQTEKATAEMLRLGLIDNSTRLKLNAGTLSFEPVLDSNGDITGHVLRDKSGAVVDKPMPINGVGGRTDAEMQDKDDAPVAYGVTEGTRAQDMAAPPKLADPTDIVLGGNPASKAAQLLGGIGGLFDEDLAGQVSAERNNAVDWVKQRLLQFQDDDQMTKDERQVVLGLIERARNPAQMAQALISTTDAMTNIRAFGQRLKAESKTVKGREAADKLITSTELVMSGLPPRDALVKRLEAINNGEDTVAEQYWGWMKEQFPALEGVEDAAGMAAPKLEIGQNVNGFTYKGGDPNDQKSWAAPGGARPEGPAGGMPARKPKPKGKGSGSTSGARQGSGKAKVSAASPGVGAIGAPVGQGMQEYSMTGQSETGYQEPATADKFVTWQDLMRLIGR